MTEQPKIPKINLLPYRAQHKKRVAQRFGAFVGVALVAATACVGAVHGVYSYFISEQEARNTKVDMENKALDKQIEEISKLKKDIALTLARKNAVENLQANRARAVKLFNYLLTLPPGVTLSSITAQRGQITMIGTAPSNSTVSVLLKQLDSSEIIVESKLIGTQKAGAGASQNVSFTIVGKFLDMTAAQAKKGKK